MSSSRRSPGNLYEKLLVLERRRGGRGKTILRSSARPPPLPLWDDQRGNAVKAICNRKAVGHERVEIGDTESRRKVKDLEGACCVCERCADEKQLVVTRPDVCAAP